MIHLLLRPFPSSPHRCDTMDAPDMSALSERMCWVCGKETDSSCSACSTAGEVVVRFCSRDCQKLVWSSHKLVCGKRRNPFGWPNLTKDEATWLIANMDKPSFSDKDGLARPSLRAGWSGVGVPQIEPEMLSGIIKLFTQDDLTYPDGPAALLSSKRITLLSKLRVFQYLHSEGKTGPPASHVVLEARAGISTRVGPLVVARHDKKTRRSPGSCESP